MKAKKVLILTCGILVFSTLASYPLFNSFAYDGAQVRPGRKIFDTCKKSKKFNTNEDVYIRAKNLFPNKAVDVYITPNKKWKFGTIIDTYVAVEYDLTTDSRGNLPCTKKTDPNCFPCTLIWQAPLTVGWYDIVVDVNQDGTYNHDDAFGNDAVFDRTDKPGLKVE